MFRCCSLETLSRVKQITSPGWMHETSARTWCTGKPRGSGWRGRWEGGSGWGTHVNPWLFHFNVWQNPLQIKKKKSIKQDPKISWSKAIEIILSLFFYHCGIILEVNIQGYFKITYIFSSAMCDIYQERSLT